jgi:hypothetical protein
VTSTRRDHPGNHRALVLALRCYPRRWKARHAEEAAELAHMLASDGVPPGSIAFDYLLGAVRARLAPLVARCWRPRTLAVLATGVIAAACLAVSTAPAPAGASGVVRVEVGQDAGGAGASHLAQAIRSHHFHIVVRQVVVPASQVGSIVAARVTGHPAPSDQVIGEIKGRCADGSEGCTVGLAIPANFIGTATVLVGRGACSSGPTDNVRVWHKMNGSRTGTSSHAC